MLRKSFAAAAIATGLLIAPGGPLAQQSNLALRVANYGGVFTAAQKKYAGDLFTARTGVKIEYIDANPPDHLAKLIATREERFRLMSRIWTTSFRSRRSESAFWSALTRTS
jgi:putative spermidine/putrescine transport system substrate-binding protein